MIQRVIILMISLLFSCGNIFAQENKSNEDKVISFDKKIHDFGDILLSDGPQTCIFTMTNISDTPIVIHNIVSSCGCTTPIWPKAPIKKGEKAKIEVTYSNDQGAFPFNKTITVYVSNVTRPVVLRIRGDVHDKNLTLENIYTNKFGTALASKTDNFSLGYILQGGQKYDEAIVANLSNVPIKVEAKPASEALKIEITPNPIPAKSTAKMKYTVNTAKGGKNWGKSGYKASFIVDGKAQKGEIEVIASINDNFDNYTKTMLAKAPVPYMAKTYYEFGNVAAGKVIESAFTLRNSGKSDLVIHKIEADQKGLTIVNKIPITIKAGDSAEIKFKFNTAGHKGEIVNVLNLITNAPTKPNINFFISGIILD